MSDNTPLNPGLGGDTVRDIDRGAAKTQVVQLDCGGEYGEFLVSLNNPAPFAIYDGGPNSLPAQVDSLGNLQVSDSGTLGAKSSDAPLFVVLTGDPNGDYGGVSWLESLLDPSNGLALTTFISNLPKHDSVGAQMQSDAIPLVFNMLSGQAVIIDTSGYQSFEVATSNTLTGSVACSGDLATWATLPGSATGTSVANTGITASTVTKFAAAGRFARLTATANGIATIYLRAAPHPLGGMSNLPVNIGLIANTAPASSGLAGALAVGGTVAAASAAGATFPLVMAGVDPGVLIRRIQTDTNGNTQQVGALAIGYQWGQYNAKYYPNGVLNTSQTAAQSTIAPVLLSGLDQALVARAAQLDQNGALLLRPAPANGAERSVPELLTELIGLTRVLAIYARETLAITGGTNVDEPDSLLADVQTNAFNNMPN
jgi:hypothetical protein